MVRLRLPSFVSQGETTMKRSHFLVLGLVLASTLALSEARAQNDPDKEHAELANAMKNAKVPLQKGISASAKHRKPISAKYELEDGKLQLAVYTMKGDGFAEVIVNYSTGKVAKVEPITGGEDLTAAKAYSEAMAKAKRSLQAVADAAIKANKGYRAVSITPSLNDGHPVAEVTLLKGSEWKTVSEKLD
jgi:hypothetical protein